MSEQKSKTAARYVNLKQVIDGADVLVVGGGGREHAICDRLCRSTHVRNIYGAPGNDGMGVIPTGISATDIDGIVDFAAEHGIYMTVVAPDDPLALGLTDRLIGRGLRAFGPTKAAAKLEWSKAYAKDFMKKYGIPTASYELFDDPDAAKAYIRTAQLPTVVKADGLALGKGVTVCFTRQEAEAAVDSMMLDKKFGGAGEKIVVEQFLSGYEVSVLVFADGADFSVMPTACDHKRALDGDKGLNTGGMGAYSPCPAFTPELLQKTVDTVIRPTLNGLISEGAPFKGVLYFGLMVCGDGIKVLEYNARFGDPEAQSILPLLKSDLFDIFDAVIDGRLSCMNIQWQDKKSINAVLASGGYPLSYKKGCRINGLDRVDNDVNVYFAGVKSDESGLGLVTNGGRVLCVQAVADDFAAARKKVYDNIAKISFDGCFYRKDIGAKL